MPSLLSCLVQNSKRRLQRRQQAWLRTLATILCESHSLCPLNVGPALPTAATNLPLVLLALVIILFSYLYSPYADLSSKFQPEDLALLQIQPCLIPGFKENDTCFRVLGFVFIWGLSFFPSLYLVKELTSIPSSLRLLIINEHWILLNNIFCILLVSFESIFCVCVCVCDFPGGSNGKESACNVGDLGSIPG